MKLLYQELSKEKREELIGSLESMVNDEAWMSFLSRHYGSYGERLRDQLEILKCLEREDQILSSASGDQTAKAPKT